MTIKTNPINAHLHEMFACTLNHHASIGNVGHIFELLEGPQFGPLQSFKEAVLKSILDFKKYDIASVPRDLQTKAVQEGIPPLIPSKSEAGQLYRDALEKCVNAATTPAVTVAEKINRDIAFENVRQIEISIANQSTREDIKQFWETNFGSERRLVSRIADALSDFEKQQPKPERP